MADTAGIEDVVQKIKEAGYKLTPARLAVVTALREEHGHLSPNEVLELGREMYPRLSRATVYRTLSMLTDLGLIRPLYILDPSPRFMRSEGGHHHLVCSGCGEVIEFNMCVEGMVSKKIAEEYGFEVNSHLLEFYGLCRGCRSPEGKPVCSKGDKP